MLALSGFARQQIAGSVRRKLIGGSTCRLDIFSYLPIDLPGISVTRNEFTWLKSAYVSPQLKSGADLIGTSLVETGVVEPRHYLQAVESLAAAHGADRYLAHRKESPDKLARVASLGLTVVQPELPLEIVARQGSIGQTLISFPSTVVHTLPVVLDDTDVQLLVCNIEDGWYTRAATVRSSAFLDRVSRTARRFPGLSVIAC